MAEGFLASTRNFGTYGLQALRCKNVPVALSVPGKKTRLKWILENRRAKDIQGVLTCTCGPGIAVSRHPRTVRMRARNNRSLIVEVTPKKLAAPTNQVFCSLQTEFGITELWGVIRCPRPVRIRKQVQALDGVCWRPSFQAVEDFLQKHIRDCAVVVGTGRRWIDSEMGFRLQAVLGSLTAALLPVVAWYDLREVWDQPLIVVGGPKWNFVSQILELSIPDAWHVASLGEGTGQVCVVERPFGSHFRQEVRNPDSPIQLVGLRRCPAALYVAGMDTVGTRACASDLLRRIRPESPELLDPSSLPAWTGSVWSGKESIWNV